MKQSAHRAVSACRAQRAQRRSSGPRDHLGSVSLALAGLLLVPQSLTPAVIIVEGDCSLVDAIHAANGDRPYLGCPAGSGADEIRLTESVMLTQVTGLGDAGPNGLPQISSDITIEGNGFTVERVETAPLFRILEVESSGTLTLNSLIVRGGEIAQGYYFRHDGGAIHSRGTLRVNNSTIADNYADYGGGIYNTGFAILTNSTVRDNLSIHGGGGIYTFGYLRMDRTTVQDNSGGGGLYAYGTLGADVVAINSTISGNAAEDVGGYPNAGGIFAFRGSVTLLDTTVADNHVSSYYAEAENIINSGAELLMVRSIVGKFDDPGVSCSGPITDGGGNFDDDGTCGVGFGELTGLDPILRNNGGPTRTHALLAESSAVDAADCALRVDQRGVPRDGVCDSGSFELSPHLILEGACPGKLTLTVRGLTPGGEAVIGGSPEPGRRELTQGTCAGRIIDLESPRLLARLAADPNGEVSMSLDVPAVGCGTLLQAVDATTCHTSNVMRLPGDELPVTN